MLMGEVQIMCYGHSGEEAVHIYLLQGDSGKSYGGLNDYAGILKDG